MAWAQRSTALLVLCAVVSVTLLSVAYVRGGGPRLLEEYAVLPQSPLNYPTPSYPSVTSEDQSPHIDPAFEKDARKSKKLYKRLKRMLEVSAERETALDGKVSKAMNFVADEVSDIYTSVQKMNKQDSDEIADVPLIPGPPGVPGVNGMPGNDGDNGPPGAYGPKGQRGPTGVQGPTGPRGVEGFEGDLGADGNAGRPGPPGTMGLSGLEGQEGLEGSTGSWRGSAFDCSEAATEHMRLVHCNRQGCRLETYFAGKWGTVCSRGFDNDNADILCKAFGFTEARGRVLKKFGGGTSAVSTGAGKIWLSGVQCLGGEGDIGDCKHSPWGVAHRCTHDDDVGICCFGIQNGPRGRRQCKSDFDFCPEATTNWARLRDCDYKACRLDVKYDGEWGTVCDSGFTDPAANVACKSLGFAAGGEARRKGGGQGKIWLSNMQCKGDELNIEWCNHSPWGNTVECDHSMDVGVCCRGPGKPPPRKAPGPKWACAGGKNSVDTGATRLVECTTGGCRLEIKHNDQWGTICSDGWKEENAVVACRSMGMPGGKSISNFGSKFKKQAPPEYKTWITDVKCKGDESWVGSCKHELWGQHECTHNQDVGVCCEKAWAKPMMSEPIQPFL